MRTSSQGAIALIIILFLFPSYASSQACAATAQNPYCDPSFAKLVCCPYPNVCYWADRQKTPACCPEGQVCGVGGGGETITAQSAAVETTQNTQPTRTTTLDGVVGTVTSDVVGVFATVTSGAVGVFSTVTSAVNSAFVTVSGVLVGRAAPAAGFDLSLLVVPALVTFWTLAGVTGFYFR